MVGAISDVGNLRSINEDYLDYYICDKYQLYIIADGMGGHNAGDIASRMCVHKIKEYILQRRCEYNDVREMLSDAVNYANSYIYIESLSNKKYKGMGTTLTLAFVYNEKIYIVNVGDSCFFAIKGDAIVKITKDHSLIQQFIDDGILTQDEARYHPDKNIITRSIGVSHNVDIDLFVIEEDSKSYYLLCTDGLVNDIDYREIVPYITKNEKGLYKVCSELVALVKERGGKDNVSLIIFGGTNHDR